MPRSRLRFLLHELDLPLGVTTIGRGADCHITLDDPLVSRRHLRIVVGADRVVVEDLDSRNGVLMNGTTLRGVVPVRDGDRLRVGTQELVFCQQGAMPSGPLHRATAELRLCANCRLPYPREVMSCPACEETEQIDEDTDTGTDSPGASSLELLVDALERAVAIGRVGDAQRLVRRTSEQIEQLVAMGGSVGAELLAVLAAQGAELSTVSRDPSWARWALDMYHQTRQVPPVELAERLAEAGEAAERRPLAFGGVR